MYWSISNFGQVGCVIIQDILVHPKYVLNKYILGINIFRDFNILGALVDEFYIKLDFTFVAPNA